MIRIVPLLVIALAARAESSPTVDDVTVDGNRRTDVDVLTPLLLSKPGAEVDRAAVRTDVKNLWKQGLFDDVRADLLSDGERTRLAYVVHERPVVSGVTIAGATELEVDELKKGLALEPGKVLDAGTMRDALKQITGKYKDKGFHFAEVVPSIDHDAAAGTAAVTLRVVEHAKVEVKGVEFLGNKAISDDELKSVMQTREGSVIAAFTGEGVFREEALQHDLLVLQSLYYEKGYVNIRVGRPATSLSADRRFIHVTIPIDEGEPYDFGELSITGDTDGAPDLRRLVGIETGQRFSSGALRSAMGALQDFFKDRGYAFVQVSPQTSVDVATRTLGVRFVVTRGPKVIVERIEIVGNSKTSDAVIRRELRASEGDDYSASAIRESKVRVTALGHFESVDLTTRAGSRADTLVLEVAVKEKPSRTFSAGATASPQDIILGNVNFADGNAFGSGISGSLVGQFSLLSLSRADFRLAMTAPHFVDTDWTAGIDVFHQRSNLSQFSRFATGTTLTAGHELAFGIGLFGTWTLQYQDIVPAASDTLAPPGLYTSGVTHSLRLALNLDRRDNRLFPSRGFLLNASAEAAPRLGLFSDENVFYRQSILARGYYPLGLGLVAKASLLTGWLQWPSDRPLSVSERFFEGGMSSVRGYRFRTISPTVGVAGTPGAPLSTLAVGGAKEFVANLEVETPILGSDTLRAVAFFDAGNVWSPEQSFFASGPDTGPAGLLFSVGVGVRWFGPMGLLRLELGVPLTRRGQDAAWLPEFSMGAAF